MPNTKHPTDAPDSPVTVLYVPLSAIETGPQQLRTDHEIDSIEELALDIQQHGLLQPIGLAPLKHDRFQLLYGSRRLAAHHYLNRATILARIHTYDAPVKALALVENIHRSQLTLDEEVSAVTHLHHTDQRSPEQIASLLSKSRAWVLRRLAIPQLPEDLRTPLLDGRLSLGAAEELARVEDQSSRDWLRSQAESAKLSVPEIRAARETMAQAPPDPQAIEHAVTAGMNAPPPPTVYLECAACHARRPPAELALIRVCSDGCAQPEAQPN